MKVFEKNTTNKNIMKSIEELQELSLVLTQYLNKNISEDKVEEEIAHVIIRMRYLYKYKFNKRNICRHINKKIKQLDKNVNNR